MLIMKSPYRAETQRSLVFVYCV